jgi:uncharacterized cupredoxin-like copper-binding protein
VIVAGALLTPRASGGSRVVNVVERDFRVSVSATRLRPGTVVFRVANRGPDAHELIVMRDSGRLPLRPDGITVNEEGLEKQTVGVLEPAGAGRVRELRVKLTPGRYVLLCNMYGHYMGGMHAVVIVR